MEQLDLWLGMSPVVFISVHYMVVVLKDHTSFMYTDSRLGIMYMRNHQNRQSNYQ